MPNITDLPCEIIAGVLRELDDIHHLRNAALSCRHLHSAYKEYPSLAVDVLTSNVNPALLPYSVALWEASGLSRPRTHNSIKQLLDTLYDEPRALTERLRHMPTPTVLWMTHLHGQIETVANEFASNAWGKLEELTTLSEYIDADLAKYLNFIVLLSFYRRPVEKEPHLGPPEILSLTSSEQFRLHRAFYRVGLTLHLFGGEEIGQGEYSSPNEQIELFLSRHPPLASSQIRDLLGTVGEQSRDSSLLEVLNTSTERQCKSFTEDSTDDELKALEPRPNTEDTDLGPFCTWKSVFTFKDHPRARWAFKFNHFNRDCAYVFWDLARVERHNLPKIFNEIWQYDSI
ncbi:hypothetical protein F5Y16DRAFT_388759 [Xylariaceae sp. FL0255]|nr:hypothetical protein F5Y16DRAFT_388759 [Xylariaceae sp. FL0255]